MQLILIPMLWSPAALAEDEPDDAPTEEPAAEEAEPAPPPRPSGLPIRVPPTGAFAKETIPPAPEPETAEDAEPLPAAAPETLADPTAEPPESRPSGLPIRVPPSDAFQEPAAPVADPPALDVPGLPAYLLPAVKQEAARQPPPTEAPVAEPAEPQDAAPEAMPADDDAFLDEITEELEAELAAEQPPSGEGLPQVLADEEPELVIDFAAPPPPDPVTWEAYQSRRLRFVTHTPEGAFDRSPDWGVKTGAGKHMTAHQFARLVGDTETLDRLDTEETWAVRRGYLLAGTGGAMLLGSAISLVNLRGVTSQYQTPLPQEGEFTDYGAYLEAYESAQAANDAQDAAAQEDRVWTAVALGAAGAITLTVAPRSRDAAAERQRSAANYYSRAEADHWMNVYNATVRQELGLPAVEGTPPHQTRRIQEEDYVDDLDTELEALEREETERRDGDAPSEDTDTETAPETTPDPGPGGAPATPGKRLPELELRVGPGWLGLSGSF